MTAILKGTGQIALLFLLSWIMNQLVALLHLKIPGSILGMVVVFILLQMKIIRIEWFDLGAKWLLADLLLFFIPSSVGIIQYTNVFANSGLPILVVVLLSTFVVMAVTGILAEVIMKRKKETHS